MGKVLASAGAAADDGPGVPLAVLGWGATAAGYLAAAANDELDDLIVTSRRAYHLVRQLDGPAGQPLLVYLRLDRPRANLAVARRALADVRRLGAGSRCRHPARHRSPRQETPAQSGSDEATATQGAAVAVARAGRDPDGAAAPASGGGPAAAAPTHRAAAPAGTAGEPGAGSARAAEPAAPAGRGGAATAPAGVGGGPPSRPGPRWADDVSTMQRLLTALRRLR